MLIYTYTRTNMLSILCFEDFDSNLSPNNQQELTTMTMHWGNTTDTSETLSNFWCLFFSYSKEIFIMFLYTPSYIVSCAASVSHCIYIYIYLHTPSYIASSAASASHGSASATSAGSTRSSELRRFNFRRLFGDPLRTLGGFSTILLIWRRLTKYSILLMVHSTQKSWPLICHNIRTSRPSLPAIPSKVMLM